MSQTTAVYKLRMKYFKCTRKRVMMLTAEMHYRV